MIEKRNNLLSLHRLCAWALILSVLITTTPFQKSWAGPSPKKTSSVPFKLNKVKARPKPSLAYVEPHFHFSNAPTDLEIHQAHILSQPLIPMSSAAVTSDNLALSKSLLSFRSKKDAEDIADLKSFLANYPKSRWCPAVEFNLGLLSFETGYLSEALSYFRSAWQSARTDKGARQKGLAAIAAGQLVLLESRLGKVDDLEKDLATVKKDGHYRAAFTQIDTATRALDMMRREPALSFQCGPYALSSLMDKGVKQKVNLATIKAFASSKKGTNLSQLTRLAQKVSLDYVPAKRSPKAPIVVPCVMHWKDQHFCAITETKGGKYHVKDPTFGTASSAWISANAIDHESDGYFLVRKQTLPNGWSALSDDEAGKVWGKGFGQTQNPCKQCQDGDSGAGSGCSSCGGPGMPTVFAKTMNASVCVSDTPLSYNAPIGPSMDFSIQYQYEYHPASFDTTWTTLGIWWSINWLSFVKADASQNLTLAVPSGGAEIYANSSGATPTYAPDVVSQATIIPLTGGGYQRVMPDGSVQNFTLSDGTNVYMTSMVDPQGNVTTISFDSTYRITSVTDACGNPASTFSYVSNTPGNSGYYLLSSITDGFGRTASFSYTVFDGETFLGSDTDAVGNVSTFGYGLNGLSSLTTPYGTTNVTFINNGSTLTYGIQLTYPDGTTSVIENVGGYSKDSYYWDREAMSLYPNDYTNGVFNHCVRTHFLWDPATGYESAVPGWQQKPLETLTAYTYAGQPGNDYLGTTNKPATVTRMLSGNRNQLFSIIGSYSSSNAGQFTITVCDQGLSGGIENVTYNATNADTPATIAAALVSAVNSDTNLSALGITAWTTTGNSVLTIQSLSPNVTFYYGSFGVTEASVGMELILGYYVAQSCTIDGTVTAGDVLTLTVYDSNLSGGQEIVNYTVQSSDDQNAIALALSSAINSDSNLQAAGVTSTVSANVITLNSMTQGETYFSTSTSSGATETIALSSNAQTWQYQYNSTGMMTQSIDPLGRTFSYTYAANGVDLTQKRETQGTDNYSMGYWQYGDSSAPHQPTLYIDGSGQQTSYTYNALAEQETMTDANGNTTTRSYDNNGYLTQIQGPLAGSADVTTFTNFGYGQVHTVTDSEGYTLTFGYDNLNRKISTTYPDATSEQKIYDKLDAILTKDRIGRWTQNSFDSMDRLVSSTDPLGRRTTYSWCDCGALTSITDPLGQTTKWEQDLEGRMTSKTYADGTETNYSYDPIIGRLVSETDAADQTTNFEYYADNTLSQKSYTNAYYDVGPTSYTYDPAFPRLSTADNVGWWGIVQYNYNPYITDPMGTPITGGGMVSSVVNNNSYIPSSTVNYSYDSLGRLSNQAVSGTSNSTTLNYDAMSRLTSEVNGVGTFNYNYVDDTPGSSKGTTRLASVNYPNGQVTNFTYYGNIGDQRLQQISNLNPSSGTLSQFSYGYDSAGQIKQWPQIQNNTSTFNSIDYDAASQLASFRGSNGTPGKGYLSQYNYKYDAAANRFGAQTNQLSKVKIAGSVSAGNTLTITVSDQGLSSGTEAVAYSVQSSDTTSSIAAGLAAAMTADSQLQSIGVNAVSSGSLLTIQSVSQNVTTYAPSLSSGATETITFGATNNFIEQVSVGGSKTTGDVLTLSVYDPALSGGHESVNYSVQATDTLATIASGISSAINADTALQGLGVTATAASGVVTINSSSANATTYIGSTNSGATEILALGVNKNGFYTVGITGSATASDTITLNVFDPALSGGTEAVNYVIPSGGSLTGAASGLASALNADSNLQALGLNATSSGSVVSVISNSINLTTYRPTVSSGATEILTPVQANNGTQTAAIAGTITAGDVATITVYDWGLGSSGTEVVNYTVQSTDTLASIASGLAAAINADTNLQSINVTANAVSTVVNVTSNSLNTTTFSQSVSGSGTENIVLAPGIGSTQYSCNNVNEMTNTYPGGPVPVHGTSSKPLASANIGFPIFGLNAASVENTTYTASSTGSESFVFNYPQNGLTVAYINGSASAGDVITLTVTNSDISGGSQTESYTVQANDTLYSIADALVNLVNQDPILQQIGQTASAMADAVLADTQTFSGSAWLNPGSNTLPIIATDGGGGLEDYTQQPNINNGNWQYWYYDLVGNFSFGPTEGYAFDPSNSLNVVDNYTPTSPASYYTFDAIGHCVSIAYYVNGSQVFQKIYVWSGDKIIQEQDQNGNVTKDYYTYGENRAGTNYFYSKDHLGSIRELTDSSGHIQAQYSYDPYGQATQLQGTLKCDFQYTGVYYDPTSNFNLMTYRAYASSLGRFISRDPLGESAGNNLSTYVSNNPISSYDRSGLLDPSFAFVHYLQGSGEPVEVPLPYINTNQINWFAVDAISNGYEQVLSNKPSCVDAAGTQIKFSFNPPDGNYFSLHYIGLDFKGFLCSDCSGTVYLDGALTGEKDLYDFNAAQRDAASEATTRFGSTFTGRPFFVYFTTSQHVYEKLSR